MTTLPGLEGITVARWVTNRLTTDQALQDLLGGPQGVQQRVREGIYQGDADTWVVFTILPDFLDVKGVGMEQIHSAVQFQVKAVAKAMSYAPVIPIYQRINELLEASLAQEPAQGGLILTAQRVSGVMYPERTGGIEYRHLGGLYEALTQ